MSNPDLVITGASAPVTEDDLRRLEADTGVSLPRRYREFLLRHNGGTPSRTRFATRDGKVESHVMRFAPLCTNDELDLRQEIEGFRGLIPGEMIPIAIDPVEDRVLLAVSGKDAGRVFYWAWSEEPETPTCSRRYMRLVADSFDEFLAALRA